MSLAQFVSYLYDLPKKKAMTSRDLADGLATFFLGNNRAATTGDSFSTNLVSNGGSDLVDVVETRISLGYNSSLAVVDNLSASKIFLAPYRGNKITLWTQSEGWRTRSVSGTVVSLPVPQTATCHDVYAMWTGEKVTLSTTAWIGYNTRNPAVQNNVRADGRFVRFGSKAHRYLGTIAVLSAAGRTADTRQRRLVANYYNRIQSPLNCSENSASGWGQEWDGGDGGIVGSGTGGPPRAQCWVVVPTQEFKFSIAAAGRAKVTNFASPGTFSVGWEWSATAQGAYTWTTWEGAGTDIYYPFSSNVQGDVYSGTDGKIGLVRLDLTLRTGATEVKVIPSPPTGWCWR